MQTVAFSINIIYNDGFPIYISQSTPTQEESRLISEWKKVRFVSLWYEGPEEYRKTVVKALSSCGIFSGGSIPLYIKLYTNNDNAAIWIWLSGKTWDDFASPIKIKYLESEIKRAMKELSLCAQVPSQGFLVKIEDGKIKTEITKGASPILIERVEREKYDVVVDGEATSLTLGFHDIEGRLVFIGKNMKISTAKLFEGAQMVYPTESGFVVYKDGVLKYPEGTEIPVPSIPVGIWKDWIVMRNQIVHDGKKYPISSTALDLYRDIVLFADGSIGDVVGSWRMKIGCPPLEWHFDGNSLEILDMCGFYKKIDLYRKKVSYESRYEASYGFDKLESSLLIGVPEKVFFKNSSFTAPGFCVVKNSILKEKDCLRLHNGYALIFKDGNVEVLGKDLEFRAKSVRLINGWLMIVGDEGTWAVRLRK